MTKREPVSPFDEDILTPLVEQIRERVRKGELKQQYLDIAEYMTNPDAPFPVRSENLIAFIDSMRRDAVAANMLRAASKLEHG